MYVGGIRMSTTAMSGACSSTIASSWSASAARRHHVDPRLGEQVGQTVAEQSGVVGDHDPHGSTASTVVPSAPLVTVSRPRAASTRSREAAQPGSVRVRAAVAVVVDPQLQVAVVPVHVDLDPVRGRVLLRVDDCLADHRPRGELGACVRPVAVDLDAQRHGGVPGHVVERGGQPAVGQGGRVQPVGQVAELAHRGLRRVGALGQGLAHPLRVAVELGGLELEGQGEQRLLGAVVQVPLDPAPLAPLGAGQAGP